MSDVLWQPSPDQIKAARVTAFIDHVNRSTSLDLDGYAALYAWSVHDRAAFWEALWRFCGVIHSRSWDEVLTGGNRMPGSRWFAGARLNFAENLLRWRDDREAIVFRREDGLTSRLTHGELYQQAGRLAARLRAEGIGPGDAVAGYLPNLPETVIAMLAAASLGAAWCSCSPDFGVAGVLDRFGQIAPKLLVCADGYLYGGRRHDSLSRVREILSVLPSVHHLVVVPYLDPRPELQGIANAHLWDAFLGPPTASEMEFAQLPFDHPLYIMFSSGTTGLPKCLVHSAGGTLLQHLKEHVLHCDLSRADRLFYFTTCGWMMWNWLVTGLASGATLMLYDGSPMRTRAVLWDFAAAEGFTIFGTSARYLAVCEKYGLRPRETHDLRALGSILSTGSPLAPEQFDWVYQNVKPDVRLSSISGGTDILSCFALGSPVLPVRRGELQCRGLAMDVAVFDDNGRPVVGEKGELVCRSTFPSMPLGFLHDANGSRYRAAYFERFANVWAHGDYAELTPSGGMIIYGRSDAVLNPGGARIGTAEIYRVVAAFDEVIESVVVGQEWRGDSRIVLFLVLRDGLTLDDDLRARIRARIRNTESPRHVPAKILQVTMIPRTISGKIVEIAVRETIHGRPVKNLESLANPEALDQYRNLAALQS